MTKPPLSAQEKFPEFLADQRQFFDELISKDWETYQSPAWDKSRRFEIDRLFDRVSPRRILDVGCGCGFHDVLMAGKAGVEEVVGIDYSEKSIETANRVYPHPHVSRRVEDIAQAAGSGRYDLVISFQVIEHLVDATAFLRNCQAQTAPGGYVAVVTPNRLRLANRLRVMAGGKARLMDPQHYREFVPKDLIALGEVLGLEYSAGFSYGLSIRVPMTRRTLFPTPVALRLGYLLSPLADCFCVVLKNNK
jgi:SAM-dependent methyltransferase